MERKIVFIVFCALMVIIALGVAIPSNAFAGGDNDAVIKNPDITKDADNYLHKVWQEEVEGQFEIFYSNNIGTGAADIWTTSVRISQSPTDSVWPDIELDLPSGTMLITWTETTPDGDVTYSTISRNNGKSWQEPHISHGEILLEADDFDPIEERAEIPKELTLQTGQGYYIVQFKTPTIKEWKEGIRSLGGTLYSYIPQNAFIVGMDRIIKMEVEELPYVRWTGIFQPAFKLQTHLKTYVEGGGTSDIISIDVSVFKNAESVAEEIKRLGGAVDISSPTRLRAAIQNKHIRDVAFIPDVEWIEETVIYVPFNNIATEAMNVPTTWITHGLTGTGQIVAVADTGLDNGVDDASMHPDFAGRINDIFSWPVPSSLQFVNDGADDGAADLDTGHGTHVAGSVLGNGSIDSRIKGMAYDARLIFQAVEQYTDFESFIPNPDGYYLTGIPADNELLYKQAFDAGAHIHTNSWGAASPHILGSYTLGSRDVDSFTWNNKEAVILFSAGNSGLDGAGDGEIDVDSIGSPGTAKNCITVGATENFRPSGEGYNFDWGAGSWATYFPADPIASDHLSDNLEGMAAFSSRGPTDDNRIKPDVVAPGTNIISTKSRQTPQSLWGLWPGNPNYCYSGGTSMSAPLTAGTVAMIRQFYTDRKGIDPSAALIKATLINGATDIVGQYTYGGDVDGNGAAEPIPNEHEGWGRVNLTNSIYPSHTSKSVLMFEDASGFSDSSATPDEYQYFMTAGEPLRITLVWTDYPASTSSGIKLVNNLDLKVTAPDGTVYRGNVFANGESMSGGLFDVLNNVENVYFNDPLEGEYKVEVIPFNIAYGTQPYALVVTGGLLECVNRYDFNGRWDEAIDMDVDSSGNVYVTGYITIDENDTDFLTIAYDPSCRKLWEKRYNGPGDSFDKAAAISVEEFFGKVFVIGKSYNSGSDYDMVTIAYDMYTGEVDTSWGDLGSKTFGGSGEDAPVGIALNKHGYIHVTGYCYDRVGLGTGNDIYTICYHPITGEEIWYQRHGLEGDDKPTAIVGAPGGLLSPWDPVVYVTGRFMNADGNYDFFTLGYFFDPHIWPYNHPYAIKEAFLDGGHGDDFATDIDVAGAVELVYVTGASTNADGNYDYLTVVYDHHLGEIESFPYDGHVGDDWPVSIHVGESIYVTGWSIGTGTHEDYVTIGYDRYLTEERWGPIRYATMGIDKVTDMVVSPIGDVFVTGRSRSDYTTVAYDYQLNPKSWVKIYDGSGMDIPTAIVLDPFGMVWVTGYSDSVGLNMDYVTIKYDP